LFLHAFDYIICNLLVEIAAMFDLSKVKPISLHCYASGDMLIVEPTLIAWKQILMARCYVAYHCRRRKAHALYASDLSPFIFLIGLSFVSHVRLRRSL
jgi:hypothetical protein